METALDRFIALIILLLLIIGTLWVAYAAFRLFKDLLRSESTSSIIKNAIAAGLAGTFSVSLLVMDYQNIRSFLHTPNATISLYVLVIACGVTLFYAPFVIFTLAIGAFITRWVRTHLH